MFLKAPLLWILAVVLAHVSLAFPSNVNSTNDTTNLGPQNPVIFELLLTWGPVAPNGHVRNGILMNGQFPGPTLELNQGDDVEFIVHNSLPFATTIHAHGIDQVGTPWSDGVPGVSQRPIQPGQSFVYRWTATTYGTYWYHAHERSHIMDGLYGAIIIKPSTTEPTAFGMISEKPVDIDAMLKAEANPTPMIVSDWISFTSDEVITLEIESGVDYICTDSVLINGMGQENCLPQDEINSLANPALGPLLNGTTLTPKGCIPPSNPAALGGFPGNASALPPRAYNTCLADSSRVEAIEVDKSAGWASINIISAAGIQALEISIDDHPMWIYAVDGRHIEPIQTDAVTVFNGDRYAAMIKLDQPIGRYTIRVANTGLNQLISTTAILSYKGAIGDQVISNPSINYAGVNTSASVRLFSDVAIKPFPASPPAQTADATYFLRIDHAGAAWKWTLNGKDMYPMALDTVQTPILFDPTATFPTNISNVIMSTALGQWVDIIVSVNSPSLQPPHALHRHSTKTYVIGSGVGLFNYSSVAEALQVIPENFNLVDPELRDGFPTLPNAAGPTWLALRYQVTNPGVFLLHCHIQFHFYGGMGVIFIDGADALPPIPPEYLSGNGFCCGAQTT